jgi:hypothetical protein
VSSSDESPEFAALRHEIDEVGRRSARTVELGPRAITIAIAVFLLIVGHILPWMGHANGLQVLLSQGDAVGKASMVPRLFAATSAGFGILASTLALVTRRWWLAWAAALGGWFASVDGILAIWSRQSTTGVHSPGPGIGLIIAELATIAIAIQWFRTAWSRS